MTMRGRFGRLKTSAADTLRSYFSQDERIAEYQRRLNSPSWQEVSLAAIKQYRDTRAKEKAEAEAKQKAEKDAATSTADLIRQAIAGSQHLATMSQPASTAGLLNAAVTAHQHGTPVALNGDGVLRAALAGGGGTINGG